MSCLSHSSQIVIEVIIQHWPHIIRCQYYCTQHTSSLSQPEAHSIDATVDEQTNSQSQSTITVIPLLSGFVSAIKCAGNVGCSCHIFFSSTALLIANGNFLVVPLLHSVSDIISQCVAVRLATTAPFTLLSHHTHFH